MSKQSHTHTYSSRSRKTTVKNPIIIKKQKGKTTKTIKVHVCVGDVLSFFLFYFVLFCFVCGTCHCCVLHHRLSQSANKTEKTKILLIGDMAILIEYKDNW